MSKINELLQLDPDNEDSLLDINQLMDREELVFEIQALGNSLESQEIIVQITTLIHRVKFKINNAFPLLSFIVDNSTLNPVPENFILEGMFNEGCAQECVRILISKNILRSLSQIHKFWLICVGAKKLTNSDAMRTFIDQKTTECGFSIDPINGMLCYYRGEGNFDTFMQGVCEPVSSAI